MCADTKITYLTSFKEQFETQSWSQKSSETYSMKSEIFAEITVMSKK